MGIYCYTLRKNTIKATDMDIGAPIEIGITEYAYKESWNLTKQYKMRTARAHAAAERARIANPNLVLVTTSDPKKHNFDKHGMLAVYRCSPDMEYFYDTQAPGSIVGYIYKNSKKLQFERVN